MKQLLNVLMVFVVVLTLATSVGAPTQNASTAVSAIPPAPQVESAATNLLIDGDMEMQPYYWRYPNHFIAPYWNRWWYKYEVIPEYDDTRGGPRPNCVECDGGAHAQVYFKWGPTYQAGIYQVVTGLTQCTPYKLSAYARNHSLEGALPHARVGLDPQGTQLTPNDDVGDIVSLPPKTVWSREQTMLGVWEQLTVQTEPLGDRLTAILYASPRPGSTQTHYYDSFWDAAALVQTTFPDNHLPAPSTWSPSGFIYDVVTTTTANSLTIAWKTQSPASTQVRYEIVPYQPPISSTILISLTHRTYMPFVARHPSPSSFTQYTPLNTTPVTNHQATLRDIQPGDTVLLVPLSRRPKSTGCTTETYPLLVIKFDMP